MSGEVHAKAGLRVDFHLEAPAPSQESVLASDPARLRGLHVTQNIKKFFFFQSVKTSLRKLYPRQLNFLKFRIKAGCQRPSYNILEYRLLMVTVSPPQYTGTATVTYLAAPSNLNVFALLVFLGEVVYFPQSLYPTQQRIEGQRHSSEAEQPQQGEAP